MNQGRATNPFKILDEIHKRITVVSLQIQELFRQTYDPKLIPSQEDKNIKLKMVTNELKELEEKINHYENELKNSLPYTQ